MPSIDAHVRYRRAYQKARDASRALREYRPTFYDVKNPREIVEPEFFRLQNARGEADRAFDVAASELAASGECSGDHACLDACNLCDHPIEFHDTFAYRCAQCSCGDGEGPTNDAT